MITRFIARPGLTTAIAVLAAAVCLTLPAAPSADTAASRVELLDLEGRKVRPLDAGAPTAFIFTRTDCPISNRYAPEFRRIYEAFAPRDVRFWLVYPDPDEPIEAIRRHLKEYDYPVGALRDPRHDLVRLTEATVTPEAVLFNAAGQMVYRGRIDNRFVDFGKTRPKATVHDLEAALQATLEGRPVEPPTTVAVGCYIPDLE